MAINADTLLDRLHLKTQITRWRLLAIIFAALAAIAFLERNSAHSPIESSFVARIAIEGIMLDDQRVYDLIDEVAENSKAKALIVWLDTPGGSAVAGEEMFLKLRQVAEVKPVVAVMRSVAASAGYMTALGADYIVAREGTITGSIGVLMESIEAVDLAEKLGLKPVVIKTSPLKANPNPLERTTPEAEQVIRDVINDFHGRFITIVAERRSLPRETVVTLADGRVYSGSRAVKLKLIDAIGGENEAMQWLITQRKVRDDLEIKDVEIDEEPGFFKEFTQSVAGKFFKSNTIALDGMAAVWHPQLH